MAGRDRDREHLLEGVQPGLAGLRLDEVEHLVLPLDQQIVEAQQDGGTPPDRQRGPGRLGAAGELEGDLDVRGGGPGQAGQPFAGQRGDGLHHAGFAGGGDPGGEAVDQ